MVLLHVPLLFNLSAVSLGNQYFYFNRMFCSCNQLYMQLITTISLIRAELTWFNLT